MEKLPVQVKEIRSAVNPENGAAVTQIVFVIDPSCGVEGSMIVAAPYSPNLPFKLNQPFHIELTERNPVEEELQQLRAALAAEQAKKKATGKGSQKEETQKVMAEGPELEEFKDEQDGE